MLLKENLDAGSWQSLLQRGPLPESEAQRNHYRALLAEKRVLITGAGGCIGSALAKFIAPCKTGALILLDTSEGALYDIHQTLSGTRSVVSAVPVLASVCDGAAITNIFNRYRPEIVLHAAACKHVPLMEQNPFAAVTVNALGTQVLADAAVNYGCEQVLMVSTDKAVMPSSIMGASKRIAELVLLNPRPQPVCMKAVRLGNVLGSSGSVVPLFRRQIAQGGPITISHPDARRYFMTLDETVDTLLCAIFNDSSANLMVPELGEPIHILDLARYLMRHENEVPIVFTELRPGDKMEECLISKSEFYKNISGSPLREVHGPLLAQDVLSAALNDLRMALQQRNLSLLLQTVQNIVPDYQLSRLLRDQLQIPRNAMVSA